MPVRKYSTDEKEILREFGERRREFMNRHDIKSLTELAEYMLKGDKEEQEVLEIGRNIPGYTAVVEKDLEAFQEMIIKRDLEAKTAGEMRGTSEKIN